MFTLKLSGRAPIDGPDGPPGGRAEAPPRTEPAFRELVAKMGVAP